MRGPPEVYCQIAVWNVQLLHPMTVPIMRLSEESKSDTVNH